MIRYRKIGGIHYLTLGRWSITVCRRRKADHYILRTRSYEYIHRPVVSSSDRGVLRRAGLMCSPYNELED